MSTFYINLQNIKLNIEKDLPLTGIYSIISKNTDNINIVTSNNISGNILANNSNIDSVFNNSNNINNIKAINNSLVKTNNIDLNKLLYKTNTIINFPEQKHIEYLTDINSLNKYTSYKIADNNNFKYFTTNNNEYLSAIVFSKQLVNNGKTFIWLGNTINDLLLCSNIIGNSFIIKLTITTKIQLHLNNFPKNLRGKTLKIILDGNNISYTNTIICSGFYNGNILITSLNSINYHKLLLKDLENVYLNNIKFNSNTASNEPYIYADSIENLYILACDFDYPTTLNYDSTNITNIKNITSFTYLKYKNNIYTYYKNNNIYGIACLLINSTVLIKNSTFSKCSLVTIIAALNSKITSYNNTFNFDIISSENILDGFRKIIFYGIANSLINSSNCKANIGNYTFNDDLMYSINTQLDKILANKNDNAYEVNRFTFLYGYVHPGSIFNHYHKDNILKKQQYLDIDNIANYSLPIGSIYSITTKITDNKLLTNNTFLETSDIYFGNHLLNTSPYIGNSYTNGCYHYTSSVLNLNTKTNYLQVYNTFLNDVGKITNTGIFPITGYTKRNKNEYIENIKYAYIFKWHFNLNTSLYFNPSLSSANSIKVSIPSAIMNNIFDNTNYKSTIQYSRFTYYNKEKYFHPSAFILAVEIKRK